MIEDKVGQILIAEPFMEDPNFKKAVVLVCDFKEEHGTVGFILNKPVDMRINQLLTDFPEFEVDVYFGGPVGHDTVHYVHTLGHLLEDSVEIRDGLFWGGDFNKLKFLITSDLVSKKDIKFFIGYSGWSPGQLIGELEMGSWVVDEMDNNYLINIPPDNLWKSTMQNKGDSFSIIADIPDRINWN
ncbi:YqgE/AlgH family protein [Saprospiraceae bacterium]|nr:YqgE/AlgH family protein [Saprospiraceae bacterium]